MVTLKEIAKECGVSTATVSNILNGKNKVSEETRKRVMDVIEERGYKLNYIAQGLRKQKSQTIGVIAEDIAQFTTPEIIEGIMEVCEERGYRTIVQNLRLYSRWQDLWFDNEKMYHSVMDPAVQEMASIRVDGIVYVAGHARKISRFPSEYEIPSVLAYAYSQDEMVPSVVIDDEDAVTKRTFLLIELSVQIELLQVMAGPYLPLRKLGELLHPSLVDDEIAVGTQDGVRYQIGVVGGKYRLEPILGNDVPQNALGHLAVIVGVEFVHVYERGVLEMLLPVII